MRFSTSIIPAFGICVLTSGAIAQPLGSSFDSSSEGWTVETHANPAGTFAFIQVFAPDYFPAGGAPNGCISEVDPDNNWSFFRAPASWSGDRSVFSGGWLRYSTRTNVNNFPDGRLVILVGDNGEHISCDLGVPDINTWTHRQIRLNAGSWYAGTDAAGTQATQAQIDNVLADLEALFIGLEFGSDLAEEVVALDNVSLSDCTADFTGEGALDIFDVFAFLEAFNTMAADADFTGDGSFDIFDVFAFLDAFNAGCP